jgi:hypothetical protein
MVNMFVFVPDLYGYSDITGDYELCENRTFVQFAGCLWVCGDIWMIPDNMPQAMRMAVLHKYGQVPIPTTHLHSDGRILRRYSIGPETAYETSGGDCEQQAAIQAQPAVPPPMVMATLSNGAARSRDKTPVRKRVRVSVTASQMIGSAFFGGTTAAEGAATADVWSLVKLPEGVVAIPNLLLTREIPAPVITDTHYYDVFATILAALLVVTMVVAVVLILEWLIRYCHTLTVQHRRAAVAPLDTEPMMTLDEVGIGLMREIARLKAEKEQRYLVPKRAFTAKQQQIRDARVAARARQRQLTKERV